MSSYAAPRHSLRRGRAARGLWALLVLAGWAQLASGRGERGAVPAPGGGPRRGGGSWGGRGGGGGGGGGGGRRRAWGEGESSASRAAMIVSARLKPWDSPENSSRAWGMPWWVSWAARAWACAGGTITSS